MVTTRPEWKSEYTFDKNVMESESMKKKDIDKIDDNMQTIQTEYEEFLTAKNKLRPWFEALKIIALYIFLGGLWILLSDRFVYFFVKDLELQELIQLYKGWGYVFITGGIFYVVIKRVLVLYSKSIDKILSGYEDLLITHEEMISMNEELKENITTIQDQQKDLFSSEQRYQLAVEGANDGIWDWDVKTGVYFFSLKSKSIYGYGEEDFAPTIDSWKELIHPVDRANVCRNLDEYLLSRDGVYEATYRLRCKSGQYRWILSRGKGIWDENNQPSRMAGSHTDITELIHLQESLRAEKELSDHVILDANSIIIVFDTKQNIIQFNPYAEKVFGMKREEVLGKQRKDVLFDTNDEMKISEIFYLILKGEKVKDQELNMTCFDGKERTILWNCNALHDENGTIDGLISIGTDVTERREMEEKLRLVAYYDSLTGLPNRAYLEKTAMEAIKRKDSFAIINMDMDNFKHINDTMGHDIGDEFIQNIGRILCEITQKPDVVVRLSGDQFAFLFYQSKDKTDLTDWLNQVLAQFRNKWCVSNQEFLITASIGVAIYPQHGEDFSILMQNADIAMFYQKANGKDGFAVFHNVMYEKTIQYIEMGNQLKDAIENEEFLLYYQPQYNLATGQLIGVEALIRWNHPEKGFIPPCDFIPFSEQTGYIVPISEWVLKKAIQQKRDWEAKGFAPVKMAVNLSGYIFTDELIFDNICNILLDMNIAPNEIEVEVTETAVMMELEKAKNCLQKLKNIGISIAMDDFGTGYSSLNYLQILPFDVLKIDKEFIKNVLDKKENYIYKTVIDLAHAFGLSVVAEGVETLEQKDFLIDTNCDIGQGYYYSRPVPPNEIEQIL